MATDNLLDSSNYPRDHPLFSIQNKAKLGCVKDECGGTPIMEAIFLRPKCYSLLLASGKTHKRAKGVQRSVVVREIQHQHYIDVMDSEVPYYTDVRGFRSHQHSISTITTNKRALSLFEDKRCWVDSNKSWAYGHWRLCELINEPLSKKLKFCIDDLL